MIDVLSFIPGKRKQTSSGWISFNAVCCSHRGQSQDKRGRGGLKPTPEGWSYHCFNCGFTASFVLGRTLSFKARSLLKWLGVDNEDIELLNLESLKHRSVYGLIETRRVERKEIKFEDRDLPPDLEMLSDSPEHEVYRNYLTQRGLDYSAYPYMVSPTLSGRASERIVIPFTYSNEFVGHCSRYIDGRQPKYINDTQPGYVFGVDLQRSDWQWCIVTEGVFDALSIDGLAVLHNDINTQQVEVIKQLNRQVVVVPDQDRAGMTLIDRALEQGWAVSIPEWPEGVKDVNDAVVKLGRLGALLTIVEAKETSKIKIEMRRRHLAKTALS